MIEHIRVLHVLSAMDRAGTENLLMSLYRNVDRSKVQFDFAVCATKKCAFDDEIRSLGGKIYHYPRYRGINHFAYTAWWNGFYKAHPEYKIIHGHIGSTAAIYLGIAKKYDRITIAHSHSTRSTTNAKSIAYRIYAFPTRYIADYFFGCSYQALVDRYGRKVAADKKKAAVLNNAIDAKKFIYNNQSREAIREELSIGEKELIIGTCGRLTPQKNPFFVIAIVEQLVKKGLKFRFLWVGTGELETEIKKKIKSLHLEKYFIMTGVRGDIPNVLCAMDIFVFPSLWEGLGIACVEAQASGLPSLCSDTIPKEAKATDLAVFLPIDDVAKWCDEIFVQMRINNKLNRSDVYRQIIESGYDIHKVTSFLEKIYLEKL